MERPAKPIVFTRHAHVRMLDRGVDEEDVRMAIRTGRRESTALGRVLYRLDVEFNRRWKNRYYVTQQVVAIVAEEPDQDVVVTVYAFYFGTANR